MTTTSQKASGKIHVSACAPKQWCTLQKLFYFNARTMYFQVWNKCAALKIARVFHRQRVQVGHHVDSHQLFKTHKEVLLFKTGVANGEVGNVSEECSLQKITHVEFPRGTLRAGGRVHNGNSFHSFWQFAKHVKPFPRGTMLNRTGELHDR